MKAAGSVGGAIAAGHPVTASVGAAVLADGGNAVDACVAAGAASWLAEPTVTGPGGGGFMLVHDARRARTVAFDFFVAVPGLGLDPSLPPPAMDDLDVHFGTTTQLFRVGPGSCAVPGVPAGLAAAHRRFGRLPWRELMLPAIELAERGVPITGAHEALHAILDGFLRRRPESAEIFGPTGRALRVGDVVRNARLGETLERVAEHGAAELYSGETGREIARYLGEHGSLVTLDDLAAYRVIVRRPLAVGYRGRRVLTTPPPSSGGVLIAHTLAVLDRLELASEPFDLPSLRRLAGALRSAQAQRTPALERALWRGGAPSLVLDESLVAACASGVDELRAVEPAAARGTTQISVVDSEGNAATMTCSTGCGSGVVAGSTGVHINNMLGETDLVARHARQRAGQRMTSMMAPSLVLRDGQVEIVLGSSGSERIRSSIVQNLVRTIDNGLGCQQAIETPRLHPNGDILDCEGGFPQRAMDELEQLGERILRWPDRNLYFGGAQVVARHADGTLDAAGDPRRGGAGIVVAGS